MFRDISSENLGATNLSNALLVGATLTGANLAEAILVDANLERANLAFANLREANLDGANLGNAMGLTRRQVAAACGKPASLPEGIQDVKLRRCINYSRSLEDLCEARRATNPRDEAICQRLREARAV